MARGFVVLALAGLLSACTTTRVSTLTINWVSEFDDRKLVTESIARKAFVFSDTADIDMAIKPVGSAEKEFTSVSQQIYYHAGVRRANIDEVIPGEYDVRARSTWLSPSSEVRIGGTEIRRSDGTPAETTFTVRFDPGRVYVLQEGGLGRRYYGGDPEFVAMVGASSGVAIVAYTDGFVPSEDGTQLEDHTKTEEFKAKYPTWEIMKSVKKRVGETHWLCRKCALVRR